jgi:hypothetical protein
MLRHPTRLRLWIHFLVNTPTIVATVDAVLAAAIVVLVMEAAGASRATMAAAGVVAFLAVWGRCSPGNGTYCGRSATRHPGSPHRRRHRSSPTIVRDLPVSHRAQQLELVVGEPKRRGGQVLL